MLSLVSDSASLSSLSEEPFAPLQIFAIHDLLHRWGEFLVLSAPPPNPVLEATKTTPAQTLCKEAGSCFPNPRSPGALRPKRQQCL